MKILFNIVCMCVMLAYPLLVYFGLQHFSISSIAPVLLVAIVGRFILSKQAANNMPWLLPATILGGSCVLLSWLFNSSQITLFYPVVISSVMLISFAYSLFKGPSVIESFALLDAKRKAQDANERIELPAHVIAYTRKVTYLWCGFFVVNIIIASGTVYLADMELWTLYNGLVAYILMGVLLAGELLVRHFVQKRHETSAS